MSFKLNKSDYKSLECIAEYRILTVTQTAAIFHKSRQVVRRRLPPQSDIPSAKWSISNRILQFLADTSDARGFRQWNKAGRKVKKGAKAFHILGPKARTITETDDDGTETEKVIVSGFFAIPVFRAEDTDGEPLPYGAIWQVRDIWKAIWES